MGAIIMPEEPRNCQDACLGPDEVEAFVAGTMADEALPRAQEHLSRCDACRGRVATKRAEQQLAGDLREAFQSGSAAQTTESSDSPTRAARLLPDSIEGYEILGEIHRGGQGVVYKAVQKATKRTVALKVLLQGPYASTRQRYRFEREIDLAATLSHPNIVTIYDSGVSRGRWYFAMAYIHGQSLDAYLAGSDLSVEQTLRLFARICAAINYAHQRGVIHRDLKPSNIRIDANGEPHLLDFGLAKTAGASVSDGRPVTVTGEFMGTLAYASPEQTRGDPSLIDVRTDVYSLGVILYEMLTGRYPYPVVGQMADVLRNISEAEPKKPSTIRRQINEEIETIVLKALAKEKGRRYQSAEALGRDVDHYLNGEAIDAKRDSAWYVVRKSLRRHRVPVAVAAAFVVLLAGATVGLSMMYQKATVQARVAQQERDRARRAEELAEQRRAEAEDQRGVAEHQAAIAASNAHMAKQEAAKAEAVNQFLQEMLGAVDPESLGGNRDVTVREVLDAAAGNVGDGSLRSQPEVEAAVRTTLGATYRALGEYPAAETHLRKALEIRRRVLGSEHPDVALALNHLAYLLREEGKPAEAEALMREALAIQRKLWGEERAEVGTLLNNLASLLQDQGKLAEAESIMREGLAVQQRLLGEEHLETATTQNNLGTLLRARGKPAEAESSFRAALATRRRLLGDEHVLTATTLCNLAGLLRDQGKPADAEPLYRQGLAVFRRLLGNEHPHVATTVNELAVTLRAQSRLAEAEPLAREALAIYRESLGDIHPYVAASLGNLAHLLSAQGRLNEAEELYREALGIYRQTWGNEHPHVAASLSGLATSLRDQGNLGEAEPLFREALALYRKLLGDKRPRVASVLSSLAGLLRDTGQLAEAEQVARAALKIRSEKLAEGDWRIASTRCVLGGVLSELGRFEDAESLLLEAYVDLKEHRNAPERRRREALAWIARLYEAWGRPGQAAEWRAKLPPEDGEAPDTGAAADDGGHSRDAPQSKPSSDTQAGRPSRSAEPAESPE